MKAYNWNRLPNLVIRGAGRWCHIRVEMDGKEHWRSLKIQADPEGKNAPFVIEAMRAFKLQLARDTFAILNLTRTQDEHSTFAQLKAAYRAACAGRDIAQATVERNIKDLDIIVRAVKGPTFSVDAARLSLCTQDLLIDFRSKRLEELKIRARAEKWDPETYARKLHSAKVTIKSTIHHARSLFAQEVMQERAYRELVLPDLKEFMAFRPGGSTTREFTMPGAEVLKALREGATLFRETRPALWLALALTANFGLRRGSALHAKWSWFREKEDGSALLHVRLAKGNHSQVGVTAATWAALKSYRPENGEGYVIPGELEARDQALDDLKDWLRQIGFDEARCPVHELRGLFVNKMAAEHSLAEAVEAVGHSSERTTRASYFARGTEKAVDVV